MTNSSTWIHTDFQPYLLPHTDAWALSVDKAMELLNYLAKKGVKQVYCTPPVKIENKANTSSYLQESFRGLQEHYTGSISLRLAATYRLDANFLSLLKEGELLTIGKDKELLIDASPLKQPNGFWEMIEAIGQAGYTPVLMQPERWIYGTTADFARLKESGCRLMLNLYSLFGYHGDEALNYSRMLLRKEWYTYLWSGMEDTKMMRYSESLAMDEDDELWKKWKEIERNSRLLWQAMENE